MSAPIIITRANNDRSDGAWPIGPGTKLFIACVTTYDRERPAPLNQRVQGSSPCAPAIEIKDLRENRR
jgi:hypothetical protein